MKMKTEFVCTFCESNFEDQEEFLVHLKREHHTPDCLEFRDRFKKDVSHEVGRCHVDIPVLRSALDGLFRIYTKKFDTDTGYDRLLGDPLKLLCMMRPALSQLLVASLLVLNTVKAQLCITILYRRGEEEDYAYFCSVQSPILHETGVSNFLDAAFEKMGKSFEAHAQRGSGWILQSAVCLETKIGKYDPLRASSYLPLPKPLLKKKKYVVNIQNEDEKCFLYSVLAARENCYFVDPNAYRDFEINDAMLNYPVQLGGIDEFEEKNGLAINVLGYTVENGLHPLRVAQTISDRVRIDLLLITQRAKFHYCAIIDVDGFLSYRGSGTHKKYHCPNCLCGFTRKWVSEDHRRLCIGMNSPQRLRFLKPGQNQLRFTKFSRQNPHHWVVIADFESMLVPVHGPLPSTSRSSTTVVNKHVPISYGYVVVGPDNEFHEDGYYFGTDAVEHFIDTLKKIGVKYQEILSNPKPMKLTPQQWRDYNLATSCHYCGKEYSGEINPKTKALKNPKVRDHCHWTGMFRGAAHSNCNLNARELGTIPVCFHGLTNYDGHLLVKAAKSFTKDLSVIAINSERYKSMSVKLFDVKKGDKKKQVTLKFIDTNGFLSAPLAVLAENYKNSGGDYSIMRAAIGKGELQHLFSNETNLLDDLTGKGSYPYEWVNGESVFEETKLPAKEAFYSSVKGENISDEEYDRAQSLWDRLTIKKFSNYHKVYQLIDVYLLAQIFQNFRKMTLDNYHLDPCYYLSTPGLSWSAALRLTKVELELFTDVSMHNFIASGIRGGLSYIANRRAVANDPRFHDTYNPAKPPLILVNWDANALYSEAMTRPLPYSDFSWLSKDQIKNFQVESIPAEGEWGYILEVDLEYPETLHKEHSDYPLAPEKRAAEEVSDFTKNVAKELGIPIKPTVKLVSTLYDKRKYVVHYRNLQFYLRRGLRLIHIRRILQFKQRAWLKPYIEENIRKRRMASNSFEKDFRKLYNNSIFGKTIENKQKRVNVKVVTNVKRGVVNLSLPHADSFQILEKDMITVLLKSRNILCDLPTYLGFTILELSKLFMYEFYYDVVKDTFKDKVTLNFTDTDSLCLAVETDDIFGFMVKSGRFDTSNFPSDHPLYSEENKQSLGYFKDELGGEPMIEFVGLRSKMYSYTTPSTAKQTAKGIKKNFVKQHITHEDYVTCLESHEVKKGTYTNINSKCHELTTDSVTKSLLSPFDDKRYIADDGITTFAHGHWKYTKLDKPADDFDPDIEMYSEGDEESAVDIGRLEKIRTKIGEEERERRRKKEEKLSRLDSNKKLKRKRRLEMTDIEKIENRRRDAELYKMRRLRMAEPAKKKAREDNREATRRCRKNKTLEQKLLDNEKRRAKYNEKFTVVNLEKE